MANGIEWALFDPNRLQTGGADSRPGQQGLSQVVACKQAGAKLIIVTGTPRMRRVLKSPRKLGRDFVIDVQKENPLERIMEVTGGYGVDVSLDCTAARYCSDPARRGSNETQGRHIADPGRNVGIPEFPYRQSHGQVHHHQERGAAIATSLRAGLAAIGVDPPFPLDLLTTHRFVWMKQKKRSSSDRQKARSGCGARFPDAMAHQGRQRQRRSEGSCSSLMNDTHNRDETGSVAQAEQASQAASAARNRRHGLTGLPRGRQDHAAKSHSVGGSWPALCGHRQ